ncbi:hypothetical protein QYE76_050244 [Lolium multiflorum]|uniref:RNase H type-1 domain-containing protein n=1 Tax=Lolium multiflorum TaxID=4521 RepID=A0AAD8SQQ0_LOLMU|nr:hypothetical protein QYE76_050244 [Lolium multiflorum]
MYAFIGGLQRGGLLRHKLTCLANANKLTLDEMISIASDHTAADDDAGGDIAATAIPLHQQKKNRDNGNNSGHKRKNPDDQKSGGSDLVAVAFQRGGGGGRGRGRGGGAGRGQQHGTEVTAGGSRAPQTYEEYRDMPCLAHLDPVTGKSTHTNRNCKWVNDLKNDPEAGYKRARKHRPRGKGGKGKNKDKDEDSSEAMRMITRRTPRQGPQYVRWSEIPCTFDREDHPVIVPKECYALVVSPRIDGYDFSKCLMDGGASLNIMYLETLERMNLTKEQLKHSTTEFHGVVPGKKANSLGSITLPVAFGDVHNFRQERIMFEVVPFKSSYHVIFGRPTYHKFHARACYIYNKLKIPGPKGMITISGDYKKAHECELGEAAFAESVISGEELQGYRAAVDPTEMQTTKKQISEDKASFKAAIETKKESALVEFLRANMDIFAWQPSDMSGVPRELAEHYLNINPGAKPVKQAMRRFGDKKRRAIGMELAKLLEAGATYQRTMQRCLKDQIGRNVHAYVDDIAVMTRKGSDLISDLTETFENLRRFVSRLGEKALPLYKLLKKTDKFVWDEAADAALQGLKEILTSPPILAAPGESEPMLLTGSHQRVISLVIVVERQEEEYEALLHGLRIAKEIGIKHIICCGDSDLVAQQVAGTWNARNSVMAAYETVDEIAKCFLGYEVKYVRRDDNTAADMLSKLGSGRKPIPHWNFPGASRIPSVKGANPENPEVADLRPKR